MVQASNWQKIQPYWIWIGLDWVGLGRVVEFLGIARCWICVSDVGSAWNRYKLTIPFAGLESQTRKMEDSHHSNLSSCNYTILWTFRFLAFSTSMAADLKHVVVVIQEFVAWQACWTNPLCVCTVSAIVSKSREFARCNGCWITWIDMTHHTHTKHPPPPKNSLCWLGFRLRSYDVPSHVVFVRLPIDMMNLCLSLPSQHFAANLNQVRVDKFVIIKGMAKASVTAEHERR